MATTLYLSGVNAVTTDGILDLNGANIELLPGWRPRVAKRRRGVLGGERYEDVVESIPLRVFGASPANCTQFLELLAAAMDQARSWKDGAAVGAVILHYAINGTELANPLQAAVLGTPIDAADILSLPVTFNQLLQVFEVNPVTLPVERRGLWLGDEESEVNSSASENPVVNTASFTGALVTPSPVKVNVRFTSGNGDDDEDGEGLVFIGDDAQKIYSSNQVNATTTGTSTINLAHADADASANEVVQIVPNDTVSIRVTPLVSHTFFSNEGPHLYMFFWVVQNLSSSVTWSINQINYVYNTYADSLQINPVLITPDNNNPQIVQFGPFAFAGPFAQLPSFDMTPSAGPGSGHELEIDTIAIVDLTEGVTALTVRGLNFSNSDNQIILNHNLLSRPKPSVLAGLVASSSEDHPVSHEGMPTIFNNTDEIACLVLGIQQNNWILGWDSGGGFGPVQTAVYATRRPAYLVPR